MLTGDPGDTQWAIMSSYTYILSARLTDGLSFGGGGEPPIRDNASTSVKRISSRPVLSSYSSAPGQSAAYRISQHSARVG